MSKLMIALIASTLTSVVIAQTASPALTKMQRQDAVQSAGAEGSESATAQEAAVMRAANVRASREVAKLTRDEKRAFFKALQASDINPNNPTGAHGTAAMQVANTAASKQTPKNRPSLNTPEARKALQAASTQ